MQKFESNEYIIHLRNGKFMNSQKGGRIITLPLIDELIIIPIKDLIININIKFKIQPQDDYEIEISGIFIWRVINPKKAYNSVSWNINDENYIEKILKSLVESVLIRLYLEYISNNFVRVNKLIFAEKIKDTINRVINKWGISIEIVEFENISKNFSNNLKKIKGGNKDK
ncbi:MAG: SPFH domain-containing protein [Promethearchaeota archaeon]